MIARVWDRWAPSWVMLPCVATLSTLSNKLVFNILRASLNFMKWTFFFRGCEEQKRVSTPLGLPFFGVGVIAALVSFICVQVEFPWESFTKKLFFCCNMFLYFPCKILIEILIDFRLTLERKFLNKGKMINSIIAVMFLWTFSILGPYWKCFKLW